MNKTEVAKIDQMLQKIRRMLCTLADRWADEKGHEDIREYGKVLVQVMPEGFKVQEMVKEPFFGFQFTMDGSAEMYQFDATDDEIRFRHVR